MLINVLSLCWQVCIANAEITCQILTRRPGGVLQFNLFLTSYVSQRLMYLHSRAKHPNSISVREPAMAGKKYSLAKLLFLIAKPSTGVLSMTTSIVYRLGCCGDSIVRVLRWGLTPSGSTSGFQAALNCLFTKYSTVF